MEDRKIGTRRIKRKLAEGLSNRLMNDVEHISFDPNDPKSLKQFEKSNNCEVKDDGCSKTV